MATRGFSDDEVARILARAAELQMERDKRDTDLVDIERAASEAGIDPALVRAAARELDGAPPPQRAGYFGPTALEYQIVIDGVVAAEDHERINDAFQHGFGVPVTASRLGNSLHWTYINPNGARHLQASVAVRDGRTIVRVREGLGQLMGGI
ncbi:MAG: hypothetical protein IT383_24240 [Deltaproteobacteria bacterium]|nr:hypothetical protein [Deltaproteobacteria bacterium]